MAEYTYLTRRKITENSVAHTKGKAHHLSSIEQHLLAGLADRSTPQLSYDWMVGLFDKNKDRTLSDIYRSELSGLVQACVPEGRKEEFYYALDQMNQFQMTAGWFRRSVRGTSYRPFINQSVQLLWAYALLD